MTRRMDIDRGWKLWDVEHGSPADAQVVPASEAMEVDLPEDVHEALLRAGRVPDYYVADHFVNCQWVNEHDWYFQKRFMLPDDWPDQDTALVFDGIDLFGQVWLNGVCIGETDNAFLPHRFEVGPNLRRDAENVLTVHIESVSRRLGRKTYGCTMADEWWNKRTPVRKPQFTFGWDWAPCLMSIGLDHVRLISHGPHEIASVYVRPQNSGHVDVFVEMNRQVADSRAEIEVSIEGNGVALAQLLKPKPVGSKFDSAAAASAKIDARYQAARLYTSLRVKNPQLWWPLGYGDQPLYNWRVSLRQDGDEQDRREGRFGFRQVRVYEKPFSGGGLTWGLEVNGRKILVRGANWIPTRIFPYVETDEDIRTAISRSAEAGFNMLRVWGGGSYERDAFYDLCDRHGIMIWQDFMFASALYGIPGESFRQSVIDESEHQVRRLRNRPSVVLWCGCNEDIDSWSYQGEHVDAADGVGPMVHDVSRKDQASLRRQEKELYSMILRGTVDRLTELPFVESSPQSRGDYGNDALSGNSHHSCHKYAINNGADNFRDHFRIVTSFNSEFCIQGPARKRTVERFIPSEHHWPPDDVWAKRIMSGHYGLMHHDLHKRYAEELFGPVDSLETFCRYGMVMHAEFMRAEFECVRHWRGKSGGTMVWMANDCWPTSNWSLVDYFNTPKAAFYAAKRACSPTVLVLFPTGRRGNVDLTLCNQSDRKLSGIVRWGAMRVDGSKLAQFDKEVSIGAYAARQIATPRSPDDDQAFLWADANLGDARIERITYFPKLWKHIAWPDPAISCRLVDQTRDGAHWVTQVSVRAEKYARFVHLDIEPVSEMVFSDNFFDLVGGDEKMVKVVSPGRYDQADIRIGHWLTEWT